MIKLLPEKVFAKALGSFETCMLVSNKICGNLFSLLESPTTFSESFKITCVLFFILDFNLIRFSIRQCYV